MFGGSGDVGRTSGPHRDVGFTAGQQHTTPPVVRSALGDAPSSLVEVPLSAVDLSEPGRDDAGARARSGEHARRGVGSVDRTLEPFECKDEVTLDVAQDGQYAGQGKRIVAALIDEQAVDEVSNRVGFDSKPTQPSSLCHLLPR